MARSEARRLGVAERGLALVGALALVLAALAVKIEDTRLIDNCLLEP